MASKLNAADRLEVDGLYGSLCAAHPKTFIHPRLSGRGMLPLKIGIYEDLIARYPDIRPKIMKSFLHQYTKTRWYLRCSTVAGNSRIDLDGELVSRLTEAQAKYAQAEQAKSLKQKLKAAGQTADRAVECGATGKIRFEHEGLARDAALATLARRNESSPVRTYRCPHCHGFHWGHFAVKGRDLRLP